MLVVIEGIDGSGKGTQSRRLVENLEQAGFPATLFSFPCYDETFFGREIGKYLNGVYGSLQTVPVEFAAMLYAGDRFEKKADLLAALHAGRVVVCDRYVPSNLAHQAAKRPLEQQTELIRWIGELEYTVYGLPRPDLVCYLDLPVQQSTQMVLKKHKRSYTEDKLDLHEAATDYLANVAETFGRLATTEGWCRINCLEAGAVRRIESIEAEVFAQVTAQLAARQPR